MTAEEKVPILAIDFDGTVADHAYPLIGNEISNAFETLRGFIEAGDRLILWTCREGKTLRDAIAFCNDHGVYFEQHNNNVRDHDYANSRKIYADLYIDDRMVGGFPGWDVVKKEVDTLREKLKNN